MRALPRGGGPVCRHWRHRGRPTWRHASAPLLCAGHLSRQVRALGTLTRKDSATLSTEEFRTEWEEARRPLLISGIFDSSDAAAWTAETLLGGVPNALLTDKSTGQGVRADEFLASEGGSMYIFEHLGWEDEPAERHRTLEHASLLQEKGEPISDALATDVLHARVLNGYDVPHYFNRDLYECGDAPGAPAGLAAFYCGVNESLERPEYRWVLAGAAGTGSAWHVDPNGTSAWNAVLEGSKRWVVFPVEHSNEHGRMAKRAGEGAAAWFARWDKLGNGAREASGGLEFVQQAGDTLYLPLGWGHCVLNLESSLAITQNFASPHDLEQVLAILKDYGGAEYAGGWEEAMRTSYPRQAHERH